MIILASKSQTRQRLLREAGLNFVAIAPEFDEAKAKKSHQTTSAVPLALHLATGKAFSLPLPSGKEIIVAADQTLFCNGKFYSKPETLDEARQYLIELRNTVHTLTSVVVCRTAENSLWHFVSKADITFRDFSDQALESYLKHSTPTILQSVGSYQYEGTGIQLIAEVRGDYHTILGLPILPLLGYLRIRGLVPK